MKALVIAVVLTGAVALATGTPTSIEEQAYTLTTIDQVPTKPQLDQVFGTDALVTLAGLANPSDPMLNIDPGIRLRAIHALAKYCTSATCASGDYAHQTVVSIITATRSAQSGTNVLLLRAAIETTGVMRVSTDVALLSPLLDHPSRDIRAATAHALRDLCNPQAIPPLRTRYSTEENSPSGSDQVKLAISEALRILGQCTTNP
jgi:hypothetical protein